MDTRGIDANFGSHHANTFFNDLHKIFKADFIIANPSFNLSNWGVYKLKNDLHRKYRMPLASNANHAWIQHI